MKNKEQQTALQGFWDKIALKLSVEQINEFIPLLDQAKVVDWNQRVKDKIELSEFLANNNKQQTAVEWVQSIELQRDLTLADWKQAKEMDKELTIKFALCYAFGQYNVSEDLKTHIEKFYQQTYGGNK